MTLFFANWFILGQIGQFNPNDPKWLKHNFLCVYMVSHPVISLSFTIATLVALIDPRVWLDPWGLRFQAWALGPLFLLFFAGLVHGLGIGYDWIPFGINFNAVFWLTKLYHLRQLGVCVRVGLHAYNYLPLFTHLRQKCKTCMIHMHSRRMFGFSIVFRPKQPRKSGAKTRN